MTTAFVPRVPGSVRFRRPLGLLGRSPTPARGEHWGKLTAILVVLGLVAPMPWSAMSSAEASGESALQLARDGVRLLINKDVGNERWAITYDYSDGSLTGNVFFNGGGAPQFIDCSPTEARADDITFTCFGASACSLSPCGGNQWGLVAEVTLPRDFFAPPDPMGLGGGLCPDLAGRWLGQSTSGPCSGIAGIYEVQVEQQGCAIQFVAPAPYRTTLPVRGVLTGGTLVFSGTLSTFDEPSHAPCTTEVTGTAIATTLLIAGTYSGPGDCCSARGSGFILARAGIPDQ